MYIIHIMWQLDDGSFASKKFTTISFNPFFDESKQNETNSETSKNCRNHFELITLAVFFSLAPLPSAAAAVCADESRFVLHFSWPELNEG